MTLVTSLSRKCGEVCVVCAADADAGMRGPRVTELALATLSFRGVLDSSKQQVELLKHAGPGKPALM